MTQALPSVSKWLRKSKIPAQNKESAWKECQHLFLFPDVSCPLLQDSEVNGLQPALPVSKERMRGQWPLIS